MINSFSHVVSENFISLIAVVRRVTAVTKPENVCELEKQIDVSIAWHILLQQYILKSCSCITVLGHTIIPLFPIHGGLF